MKKLLGLVVILALASMTSAVIQISVGGVEAPADSMINVRPSGHLELGIYAEEALPAGFANTWALIVNSNGRIGATGTINPAYDNIEDPPTDIGMVTIAMAYGDPIPEAERPFPMMNGVNGMFGLIVVFEGSIPADTWLIKDIDFHGESIFDAIVRLIQLDDMTGQPTGVVYDTVIVHIPEPVTIALLCLGGLMLKRRK